MITQWLSSSRKGQPTNASRPPLDRPHLLGGRRQVDECLVDKAPAPAFRRVVAFDDRVFGFMEMRRRVLVG